MLQGIGHRVSRLLDESLGHVFLESGKNLSPYRRQPFDLPSRKINQHTLALAENLAVKKVTRRS